MVNLIERDQWIWHWAITDEILSITPEFVIDQWVSEDPIFEVEETEYVWYNVLMYFGLSRAGVLGMTKAIRRPGWKTCPHCEHQFLEDSLWVPMTRVLGVNNIVYCSPCLEKTLSYQGDPKTSKSEILDYIRQLAHVLERPPTQTMTYTNSPGVLRRYGTPEQRAKLIPLLNHKPALERVKEHFGTWKNALVAAGVKPQAR